jgi:hypothetical protein
MIKPTIGRKVWFHPVLHEFAGAYSDPSQPLDATVVYVWSDTMVNLRFSDQNGRQFSATSVFLWQGVGSRPASGCYCEWMLTK